MSKSSLPAKEYKGPSFSYQDLVAHAQGPLTPVFEPFFPKKLLEEIDGQPFRIRIPGPPFLFVDRITEISCGPGKMVPATICGELDLTKDKWFLFNDRIQWGPFLESGQVLLFLLSWLGFDQEIRGKRFFRHLSSRSQFFGELPKCGDRLEIKVDLVKIFPGKQRLVDYNVEIRVNGKLLLKSERRSGFFTTEELMNPKGVFWDPAKMKSAVDLSGPLYIPPSPFPNREYSGEEIRRILGLTDAMTRGQEIQKQLLDKIECIDFKGGPWGRGYLKATFLLPQDGWFFKAHFKDDPCMPGSLMLEACWQAMKCYLVTGGFCKPEDPMSPLINSVMKGDFRGQVTPQSKELTYELFIQELGSTHSPYLKTHILIYCDGLKIAHIEEIGIQVYQEKTLTSQPQPLLGNFSVDKSVDQKPVLQASRIFDVNQDEWLKDHRPNFVLPSMPMTVLAELMREAGMALFPELKVTEVQEMSIQNWVAFTENRREIKTQGKILEQSTGFAKVEVTLAQYRKAPRKELSRFEPFCRGTLVLRSGYPHTEERPVFSYQEWGGKLSGNDFYNSEVTIAGPSLQLIEDLSSVNSSRVVTTLNTEGSPKTPGYLRVPFLLDAGLQACTTLHDPQSAPWIKGMVGFPYRIFGLQFFQNYPSHERVRCEVRFTGFSQKMKLIDCEVKIFSGESLDSPLWAKFNLSRRLIPLGAMGRKFQGLPGSARRFLKEGQYIPGMAMSEMTSSHECSLGIENLKKSDWPRGTVAFGAIQNETDRAYFQSLEPHEADRWLTLRVAAKELISDRLKEHPSKIELEQSPQGDQVTAYHQENPEKKYELNTSWEGNTVHVKIRDNS